MNNIIGININSINDFILLYISISTYNFVSGYILLNVSNSSITSSTVSFVLENILYESANINKNIINVSIKFIIFHSLNKLDIVVNIIPSIVEIIIGTNGIINSVMKYII